MLFKIKEVIQVLDGKLWIKKLSTGILMWDYQQVLVVVCMHKLVYFIGSLRYIYFSLAHWWWDRPHRITSDTNGFGQDMICDGPNLWYYRLGKIVIEWF